MDQQGAPRLKWTNGTDFRRRDVARRGCEVKRDAALCASPLQMQLLTDSKERMSRLLTAAAAREGGLPPRSTA